MKAELILLLLLVTSFKVLALTPADLPADVELFIAGSSAQDKALIEVVSSLCKDTPDKYSETGSIPGNAYTAVFSRFLTRKLPV